MKYNDDWGLLSATPATAFGENNLLYSIEHYFLTSSTEDRVRIWAALENCRRSGGIFEQHPSHMLRGKDEFMSRDQLISIFAFCVATGFTYHKQIWKEIKRQWFRYNNINAPKTLWEKFKNFRLIMPGDLIFFGYCAGGFLWKLLFPFLCLSMLVSSSVNLNLSINPLRKRRRISRLLIIN